MYLRLSIKEYKMINVYLLRHGQTPMNADNNRYCGRTDAPLTDKGIAQAESMREVLAHKKFDEIYASPLQRALHTARIIAGDEVKTDDRLVELDFGQWENKTKEEFIEEDPALWKRWMNGVPGVRAGHTGETAAEAADRISGFFRELFEDREKGDFLVVAHNALNRFYLCRQLGMPLHHYRRLWFDNSALTMFSFEDDGAFVLKKLNAMGV